jgi:hypothetical protein
VERLRQAQRFREAAELERLVRAFVSIHNAVQAKADALAVKLSTLDRVPTRGELVRMAQYKDAIETAQEELDKYATFMQVELQTTSHEAVTFGEIDARQLSKIAAQSAGISAQFRTLSPDIITQLVGFLDPRGPLYKRLDGMPGYTADQVSERLIEGVGMGQNPKVIAAGITNTLGMALTDSLRMTRTVQLWSYREASRASYVANNDVVGYWVWYADLANACPACVVMHGSEHPLDEPLDDHHNGGCTPIPMLTGQTNYIEQGADWFANQSEEQQKATLGDTKWQAWKDGKFKLADLPQQTPNDVYGMMRTERSLKDLVGE